MQERYYTNIKENTALDYEVEYFLGGKDNDRDNLSSVATELVLIRSGANLINLMLDSKKQAEIRELATAVSFGQVYIKKIAELLITMAWALAEAMLDTKALFEGKKIPLIMTNSTVPEANIPRYNVTNSQSVEPSTTES